MRRKIDLIISTLPEFEQQAIRNAICYTGIGGFSIGFTIALLLILAIDLL